MMKKFLTIICMVLIISMPIVVAQYEQPYERDEAKGFMESGLFGGEPTDVGELIVVNVDDYEPKMIRQSHLEQEGVPVFVSLRGESLDTLAGRISSTKVSTGSVTGVGTFPPIKQMTVTMNGSSDFVVRNPYYIPLKREDYSMGDLGYLIVDLKRLDAKGKALLENVTNNVITLDMNAEIRFDFDVGNVFGMTRQDLLVKQMDESGFLSANAYEQNPFFSGRGYVNAIDVSDGSATIAVYDRHYGTIYPTLQTYMPSSQGRVMPGSGRLDQGVRPTFRLTPGDYSPVLSLGDTGDPFRDQFRVRLNDIVTPDDMAVFDVTQKGVSSQVKVNRGKKLYYGSNWIVSSVDISPPTSIGKARAGEIFELDDETQALVAGYADNEVKKVTHTVILRNGGTKKVVTKDFLKLGEETVTITPTELSQDEVDVLEGKYCPAVVVGDPSFGCRALRLFQTYISTGGTEVGYALEQIVDLYENGQITFAGCMPADSPAPGDPRCVSYKKDLKDLAFFYAKKLEAMGAADPALMTRLRGQVVSSGGSLYLNDESMHMNLREVRVLEDKDKGFVSLKVNRGPSRTVNLNGVVDLGSAYEVVDKHSFFSEEGKNYQWRVYKITPGSVTLRKYHFDGKEFDPKNYLSGFSNSQTFLLSEEKILEYKSENTMNIIREKKQAYEVSVFVEDIDVKNEAYVSVIPGSDNAIAHSNFKVHIPVDPRLFEFTPEQMESQIAKTKEIIGDMQGVLDRLDKIIKFWKRTCILTFVTLTVKNSFLGGPGRNLARRSVMEYAKEKCKTQVGRRGAYQTYDECYLSEENMDDIKNRVKSEQEIIENVDNEFGKYGTVEKLKSSNHDCAKYLKANGNVDECRTARRIDLLKDSLGEDDEYYKFVKSKFDPLQYHVRIQHYDNAVKYYNENRATFGGDQKAAVDAYLTAIQSKDEYEVEDDYGVKFRTLNSVVFKDGIADKPVGFVTPEVGPPATYDLVPVTELGMGLVREDGDFAKLERSVGISVEGPPTDARAANRRLRQMSNTPAVTERNEQIYAKAGELDNKNVVVDGNPIVVKVPRPGVTLYKTAVSGEGGRVTSNDYTAQVSSDTGNKGIFAQYDTSGKAVCYPTGNGEYVEVLNRFNSGSVDKYRVMNVGMNGVIDCGGGGDDKSVYTWDAIRYHPKKGYYDDKINSARRCSKEGEVLGGLDNTVTLGRDIVCSMEQVNILTDRFAPSCADVMDPSDCKLLFNACDPVMCPSSRCTLGGRVKVDNVIQSGIVGSTLLCLPNHKQGVMVPVCLTGISAGLKNLQSVLQGYVDCLETSLAGEGDIGVCDYIRSVGMCEMVWREAIHILQIRGGIIDWLSDNAFGEPEGGVEYLTFQSSMNNVGESFNYFTTEYSNTFLAAYKGQSTEEIGSQICRMSVYGKPPSFGDILDQLSEPENPPQYTAFFDTAPYVEEVGDIPFNVQGVGFNTDLSYLCRDWLSFK